MWLFDTQNYHRHVINQTLKVSLQSRKFKQAFRTLLSLTSEVIARNFIKTWKQIEINRKSICNAWKNTERLSMTALVRDNQRFMATINISRKVIHPLWHLVNVSSSMMIIQNNYGQYYWRCNHEHDTIEICTFGVRNRVFVSAFLEGAVREKNSVSDFGSRGLLINVWEQILKGK